MKNAEASQLMDIASMAALVKPTAAPPAPPAPTRSEVGQGLAAWRLTTPKRAQPLAPTRDARAPLYWMIGALNVMVLAMAAYVVFEPSTVVVQAPVVEEEPETVVAVAPEIETPEIPGAPKAEPTPVEEPAKVATAPQQRRGHNRPRTKQVPVQPKEPAVTPSKDLPIECIVDPASCDPKKPTTEAQGPRSREPIEDLPATLSQIALRTGFSKVRGAAKACGPKHGAAAGETVEVKVSIAGGTGKVMSSSALGEHAGSALGRCVANALGQATFERFGKSQIGLKYTVRL